MAANAADEKQINRKTNRVKSDEATAAIVVRALMSTAEGRRYVWVKLSACHIFHSTFTGDPITSAFREGERNIGLQQYAEILRHAPQATFQMMVENSAMELKETANGRSLDNPNDNGNSAEPAGDDASSNA